VRPAEGVRDDACPEVRDPEVTRVDRRGIAVGETLVGHVPLPDPAFVARYLGDDVLVQQVFELGVADSSVGDARSQPVGQLIVPQQRVSPYQLAVLLGEGDKAISTASW